MLIQDLEKDDVVNRLVDRIIECPHFKEKCERHFQEIFEDGQVDGDDIPILINLVLTIYNNYNKIKIRPNHLKPVFLLLISKLLNEFKGDIEIDERLILLMLEPQIDLLLTSVTMAKTFPCCGSKPQPDKEEATLNKIRINKFQKQNLLYKHKTEILP